jgi:UDP-N-acetylmuramate: L-alanyl-gamma-D-glutamyl-meso-diaminopimelate ligase
VRVHFLGIGGTLMGNLALLAREAGAEVTGSDGRLYPPMSDVLARSGIPVEQDWGEEALRSAPDLVVIGNAKLPRGHPSVEFVLRSGLAWTSGAEWLGRHVLRGRHVIAVAGTHGKTTTTAMTAHVLRVACAEDPSGGPGWLVAGEPLDLPAPARLGDPSPGSPFVVEADEYDTSYFDRRSKFLHYRPRTLIVNNLEYDHADVFPDLAAIQQQFAWLLRTVPDDGLLVTPPAEPAIEAVVEQGCWTPRTTFSPEGSATPATWTARGDAAGTAFEVLRDGRPVGEVRWALFGTFNVGNALAALAAADHAGVDPGTGCAALCTFRGVRRRLERIVDRPDLRVYEDFAHHPTAIAATLGAVRTAFPTARVLAVIDPATHTMSLGTLREPLARSVAQADAVVWYANPALRWDVGALLANAPVPATLAQSADDVLAALEAHTGRSGGSERSPPIAVLMSNGAFGGIPGRVRDRFS